VSEIPVNANGKLDRKEALKLVLRAKKMKPPLSVKYLKAFLPHRGAAIWVDTLLETRKHHGLCEVKLCESGNYFTGGKVRESACVEWVAQTYGYTAAMNEILQLQSEKPAPRVFIVEVKECEFTFDETVLKQGDVIQIQVDCTHDFGPLKVVEGKVFLQQKQLARMMLKLYCGQ